VYDLNDNIAHMSYSNADAPEIYTYQHSHENDSDKADFVGRITAYEYECAAVPDRQVGVVVRC